MASFVDYSVPLIRDAGSEPEQDINQGGRYKLVITGDLAGATIDLNVTFHGHPVPLTLLGAIPDVGTQDVFLPVGSIVSAALMGGSPTTVYATLIFVE